MFFENDVSNDLTEQVMENENLDENCQYVNEAIKNALTCSTKMKCPKFARRIL